MAASVFLGIDPGAHGGIAVLSDGCPPVCFGIPDNDYDLLVVLSTYANEPFEGTTERPNSFAIIEKVGGYVGGDGAPGSAMFNFGVGYGKLLMALTAARIPFEEVPPQRWQKGLAIPKRDRGEGKTAWKNRLKTKAQQLFPSIKVTLATSDALLVAEYCRRLHTGMLSGRAV